MSSYPETAMMPTDADEEMKAAATNCIGHEGPWLVVWAAMAEVAVNRLAATPTPPTLLEDLRAALGADRRQQLERPEPRSPRRSHRPRTGEGIMSGGLGWDADGMCDDHGRFACETCALPLTTPPARPYADEDVARIIDPGAWMDYAEFTRKSAEEPGRDRANEWLAAAEQSVAKSLAKAAAIRLLSQGGKA